MIAVCNIENCDRPTRSLGMCHMHHLRQWRYGDPLVVRGFRSGEDRFWSKVDAHGVCWEWMAWRDKDGYGGHVDGRAHRVAWEKLVGPIPEGLQLDHLCRNRACVNPDHLEPVTARQNVLRSGSPAARMARQTHCKRGHEFTEENTYRSSRGWRSCRTCIRESRKR